MVYRKALRIAERTLVDGATLAELKKTSKDLRALTPCNALADLVGIEIRAIEGQKGCTPDHVGAGR